jgi:hypothetical protein
VGVQHEIAPRTSLEVTYVRRSWGNQTITDNRAVSAADFDRFSIVAPVDARLPNGGGYVVDGIYEVKADKFGLVDNYVTHAKNYGDGISETYNGVDITVNSRLQGGVQLQGGLNIGQSARNDCSVSPLVPESLTAFGILRTPQQFCDIASGYLTSFGGLATYIIPKIDVQIAGTVQSRPFAGGNVPGIASQSLIGNVLTFNNVIVPALGRPLAGGAPLTIVNVLEPGTFYGDRINQVDFRVTKILRFQQRRLNVGVDVFNLFNTNAPFTYITTLNPFAPVGFLQPSALVSARFAKVSATLDF